MLAGMEHGELTILLPAGTDHRSHLDDLRPCAENDGNHAKQPCTGLPFGEMENMLI